MLFGKIKDGINFAASKPLITVGSTVGLGIFVLKRPRRFLYHNTLRLILSEQVTVFPNFKLHSLSGIGIYLLLY